METSPNIVFILADDLGYGDVSCFNKNSKIPTPQLDKLANQGMSFTDAHASSALCSPSRYSLLTGRYAWRSKLQYLVLKPWDPPIIDRDRLTVASLLKQHGYATACIGKWHLGMEWPTKDGHPPKSSKDRLSNVDFKKPILNGPTARGFDYYFGVDVPNYPPYCFIENDHTLGDPSEPSSPGLDQPGPMLPGWQTINILPELTRRAVKYIGDSAKATPRKPFFLYFSITAPHYPIVPTEEFHGKSQAGDYGDFVAEVDWTVGQVLAELEHAGVAENTLIIFTSDNGPDRLTNDRGDHEFGAYGRIRHYQHSSMGDLRGVKFDTWEAGHRVPFIARWPEKIKAGIVNSETISLVDFLATSAALVKAPLPANAGEDSFNILPALLGEPHAKPIRPALVVSSGLGEFSIRKGDWMYIDAPTGDSVEYHWHGGEPDWFKKERGYEPDNLPGELYNLSQDLSEHRNLYAEHPETVKELKALLEKYELEGRSTPGARQKNDVPILHTHFKIQDKTATD